MNHNFPKCTAKERARNRGQGQGISEEDEGSRRGVLSPVPPMLPPIECELAFHLAHLAFSGRVDHLAVFSVRRCCAF